MTIRQLLSTVLNVLGSVAALVLYLVIAGIIIALIVRACPGDHSYMGVH